MTPKTLNVRPRWKQQNSCQEQGLKASKKLSSLEKGTDKGSRASKNQELLFFSRPKSTQGSGRSRARIESQKSVVGKVAY